MLSFLVWAVFETFGLCFSIIGFHIFAFLSTAVVQCFILNVVSKLTQTA